MPINVNCTSFRQGGDCLHQAAPRRWFGPARCIVWLDEMGANTDPRQVRTKCALCMRDDGMPASADERRLRRMLGLRVAMPHTYMDDGEMQGQEHGISIDFMREPVADIEAKLLALNLARFRVAEGEPPNARLT